MMDNLTNLTCFAVVKRSRLTNASEVHVQKSFAVSIDSTGTAWKVPYLKKVKDSTIPTERLILVNDTNSRPDKDNKRLYVTELFDDYGITVRIEFSIAFKTE